MSPYSQFRKPSNDPPLGEPSVEEMGRLNPFIYCHHCGQMGVMLHRGVTVKFGFGECHIWRCRCGALIFIPRRDLL